MKSVHCGCYSHYLLCYPCCYCCCCGGAGGGGVLSPDDDLTAVAAAASASAVAECSMRNDDPLEEQEMAIR